jgi:signal transduction histidine kinase
MARKTHNQPRAVGWIVAGIVGALVLMFGALTFTNSRTAGDTLAEAAALHAADMTLAGQDVAMKSIGQLVLLSQDQELGVAGTADVEAAAVEASRAITELQSRFDALDADTSVSLEPALAAWQTAASAVTSLASAGDGSGAAESLVGSLVPAADALAAELTAERDVRSAAVDDAQSRVGSMARFAGFLTVFLIPLGAIIGYRFVAGRQLEGAEAHLDARIEAEKSVGRAKDQFIASISHELRTPLTSIYGFSEALLDQGFVDPAAAGDLVGLINTESAELARMVEDLLVAAHDKDAPLAVDQEPLRMNEQIDAVIEPFVRRGHAIGGNYGRGTVIADQLRVRQILRNLLSNAVQHGGPDIRVYGDTAGSNYVVAVEDNGAGIPDHIVERLFTRFFHQGDAPLTAGSVGLGLAVAQLLAEAMGGSLDYDRVANRTAFVLSLPMDESVVSDESDESDAELLIAAER